MALTRALELTIHAQLGGLTYRSEKDGKQKYALRGGGMVGGAVLPDGTSDLM